ncbi:MAG: GNAT family N-acetyltransferase [Chloroflexota bacterium]
MLILESKRLILRPFQDADIEAFSAYRSDPDIARYQSWEPPVTLEQATRFVNDMKHARPGVQGEWYQWAVERKAAAGLIGDCAFQIMAPDPRQAEIGFTFAPAYQGQGFAAEAVSRLLDYLFGDLNLHRVVAITDAENRAAARLLERLGLRHEGTFVENIWFKGAWGSEFSYALLHREWAGKHRAAQGS